MIIIIYTIVCPYVPYSRVDLCHVMKIPSKKLQHVLSFYILVNVMRKRKFKMIHYHSSISKFDDKTNHVNSLYLCILSSLSPQITKTLNIDVHIVNLFLIPRSKFSRFHSFFKYSTISHFFETLSRACDKYMVPYDIYIFTTLINVFFDPLLRLYYHCNLLTLNYYLFVFYQPDLMLSTIL